IGDHDRAADPIRRRIEESTAQGGEQFGALGFRVVARRFGDAEVDVSKRLEPRLEFVARFVRLLRPLANVLALRAIDHYGDNVLEGTTVLLNETWIAQREQQERHAQRAQPRAANAAPDKRG